MTFLSFVCNLINLVEKRKIEINDVYLMLYHKLTIHQLNDCTNIHDFSQSAM